MHVNIALDGAAIPVDRAVFEALFEGSVVNGRAPLRTALQTSRISFKTFVDLARTAEIPYPLFFASWEVVEEQLRLKNEKLMAGFTQRTFSMHSRNEVRLSDVELIVKDLLRKQQYLRSDPGLGRNGIIGLLKKPGPSVAEDAARLMAALGLSSADIRTAKTKQLALARIIAVLERNQILVARSSKNYMPQQIPKRAKFSGMTIKDKKVPYIFLATGDEGEHLEPAGRKIFTVTLLAVLISRGTFAPVTYDGHTTVETAPREYELTAEILMPASEIRRMDVSDLDAVRGVADTFKVTPSAVVMRSRRLGLIDRSTASELLDRLEVEYAARVDAPRRNPLPVNALRNYNGVECSRRMLGLLDSGAIKPADFCRVMFSNKLRPDRIDEFRAAVQ